jgi:hypothetical protein
MIALRHLRRHRKTMRFLAAERSIPRSGTLDSGKRNGYRYVP